MEKKKRMWMHRILTAVAYIILATNLTVIMTYPLVIIGVFLMLIGNVPISFTVTAP